MYFTLVPKRRYEHPVVFQEEFLEIKYSKKKQEMRQDPFLDFLGDAKEFIDKNSNAIMMGAVAVCVLLAGGWAYQYFKKSGEEKAQEAFGKAMVAYQSGDEMKAVDGFKAVIDNNKNSPQATYSAFVLGNLFLQQGKFDEAITWFKDAESKNPSTGFVGADALEGLAASFEAKGNREEALNYLQKALEDQRVRSRFPELAWKAALLCKDLGKINEAKRFCEQIVGDTSSHAGGYKQKAGNFLAEIQAMEKS
jgi:tetratricopeptide (TPR) repeat protein